MYKMLVFVSAALLVSGVAVSGDQMSYKNLDANQDGKISAEEAAASPALTNQWTTLDANADGMIDQAEFAKMEVREMKQERKGMQVLPE